jgi:hypothetical protein
MPEAGGGLGPRRLPGMLGVIPSARLGRSEAFPCTPRPTLRGTPSTTLFPTLMGTLIPTLMGTQATRVPVSAALWPVTAGQVAQRGRVTRKNRA